MDGEEEEKVDGEVKKQLDGEEEEEVDGEVKKEVDGGEEKIGDEGEFVSNTHTHHSLTHT